MDELPPEPVIIEIDGELDLHTFAPREVKELLVDYIEACLEKEIYKLRIIHGKGTGALRRTVHATLDRIESVASYRLGDQSSGSWGATLVSLKTRPTDNP
jgi:DNA-nicking Smr family endonuclease